MCTDIAIFADSVDEPPESFSVSLRLPNLPRVSLGPISTTLVTIIEGNKYPSKQGFVSTRSA